MLPSVAGGGVGVSAGVAVGVAGGVGVGVGVSVGVATGVVVGLGVGVLDPVGVAVGVGEPGVGVGKSPAVGKRRMPDGVSKASQ